MATWKESPNWTPFDEINGGQQFTNALTPEDLNALAQNIAYLYENQGDEVIPDHTQSDFTLQLANTASGELGVVYSSTEKVSFEAAPSGEVIDTFVDTNFVPRNIKKDVEIFGVVGEYEGEGGGEVIPEFTEVEGFDVFLDEADEGTITVAYSTPQDVKLSAPSGSASAVRLASVDDENFIPSNIKSGVSIFGMTGDYEGSPLPVEVSTEAEMTALLESGEVGGVYKYTGTTGTYENGALYVLEEEAVGYNVKILGHCDAGFGYYSLNGGEDIQITSANYVAKYTTMTKELADSKCITLTDVKSLICKMNSGDVTCVTVKDSNFNDVESELYGDWDDLNYNQVLDVTQYLSEGCYVILWTDD